MITQTLEEGMKNQSKCIKIPRNQTVFDIGYRIVNKRSSARFKRNGASIFDLPFLGKSYRKRVWEECNPDFDIGKHSVEEVAIVNLSKFYIF